MNSLSYRYQTYGEMLTDLRARTGFISQGPSASNNRAIFDSILREAHSYVYAKLNPTPMRKKTVITLEPGSFLYDWHNDLEDEDIDPGLVISVWLVDGKNRYELIQGVSERHREDDSRRQPMRFDTLNGQIELWPVPDRSEYGLLIEYIAGKPRFFSPSDRPGVPSELVLLYAISIAKAQYRQPDYQAATATFNALMKIEMAKQHGNKRYFVKGNNRASGEITGSDGQYKFVER